MSKNTPDLSAISGARGVQPDEPRRRIVVPAWLWPLLLLAGFGAVMLFLFGDKFLPAVEVDVAPVVTIRAEVGDESKLKDDSDPDTAMIDEKQTLLFQASGWIEPDPYTTEVPTLVSGIVDEVFVLEGEPVEKGQLLAKLVVEDAVLDMREAEGRVATIQAELAMLRATVPALEAEKNAQEKEVEAEEAKARNLLDRSNRLSGLPAGSVATRDVAAAKLDHSAQLAMVEKARSKLPSFDSRIQATQLEIEAKESLVVETEVARDRARLALSRHEIFSPIDGVVLELHAGPGKKRMLQMDSPSSAVIVELFDPGKLQARIDVPLSEAAALGVGQRVELVTELLPDLLLYGEVSRINGEADLQRNTLQVKVVIKNPDQRLRPEMLVRAKFYGSERRHHDIKAGTESAHSRYHLFVPEIAVLESGQVWVVGEDSTAQLRSLRLGSVGRDDHILVEEGLLSGEKVILPPHDLLKPKIRIKVKTQNE